MENGLNDRLLETAGGARSGADLADLVEKALLLKNLLAFAPRKYDAAVIEAMAMAGALEPDLDTTARNERLSHAAGQIQLSDSEADWSATMTETGDVRFDRVWRGVTDVHLIEGKFLDSAEARKLHVRGVEQAETYASPARLVKAGSAQQASDTATDEDGAGDLPATGLNLSLIHI